MDQETRDMLRRAAEFWMVYVGGDESANTIEEALKFPKENLWHVSLYDKNGNKLGDVMPDVFFSVDPDDLFADNYIEKSRKVDKIIVTYGDGSTEEYDCLEAAQKGITETLNGCDLAVNVENIEGYVNHEHVCNYTAELVAQLDVWPAV